MRFWGDFGWYCIVFEWFGVFWGGLERFGGGLGSFNGPFRSQMSDSTFFKRIRCPDPH